MKHIYRNTHTHEISSDEHQMRSLVDHGLLIKVVAEHSELLNGLLVDALEPPLTFEAVLIRLFLLHLDLALEALLSALH